MKTLLIFPPFASPTFIPYHLCDLAGYIKKRNSKLDIDIWDWNIETFNNSSNPIKSAINIIKAANTEHYFEKTDKIITHWSNIQAHLNNLATNYIKEQKHSEFYRLMETNLRPFVEKYDIIGFSLTYHQKDDISQFYMTIAASIYIKSLYPQKKIILGGALLNHIEPTNLISCFGAIDYILVKESEESLSQLISLLSENNTAALKKQLQSIPNMIYKIKDEVITTNHKKNTQTELEYLPILDNIKFDDYLLSSPVVSIQYKRGCPWNRCSFCSQNISYLDYQKEKNITIFAKKIKHLITNGIKHFYIADQMITPNDIKIILNILEKNNIYCNWTFMAMPGKKFTSELLNRMYNLGCRWITWGIESGSQAILQKMNKPININVAKENIVNSHFAGIKNVLLMIYAFPGETLENYNESLDFLLELKPYYYDNSMSPYHLCYGSPMYNNPEQFGIKILDPLPVFEDQKIQINSNIYKYESSHPIIHYTHPEPKQSIPYAEHMLLFSSFLNNLEILS